MIHKTSGLVWLEGNSWSVITRDERFFCAALYEHARHDPAAFAQWVITEAKLGIQAAGSWDLGYEVCFYRDFLWLKKRSARAEDFPFKRTFDLCLFSENAIIIIEAKVCEAFAPGQNGEFKKDKELIRKLPGLSHMNVCTVALASSQYFENAEKHARPDTLSVFDGNITWAMLAKKYNDQLLQRADKMYKLKPGQLVKE